jgi:hypothetical protein
LIKIKLPTLKSNINSRTIRVETTRIFGIDFLLIGFFFRKLVSLFCNGEYQEENYCLGNNDLPITKIENFDSEFFNHLIFTKTNGTGNDIVASLRLKNNLNLSNLESNLEINIETPSKNFEVGDYTMTLTRILGTDVDSKPVTLTIQVRSHWVITLFLLLSGLTLAIWVRQQIGLGTPIQKLLRRVDTAKLQFEVAHGFWSFNHDYDIRPLVWKKAWRLTYKIQKIRSKADSLTPLDLARAIENLEKEVKILERLPHKWRELMGNLDALQNMGIPVTPQQIKVIADFRNLCQVTQNQVNNAGLTSTPRGGKNLFLYKLWLIFLGFSVFFVIALTVNFSYFSSPELISYTANIAQIEFEILVVSILVSWLWSRIVWIIAWYGSKIRYPFQAYRNNPNQKSTASKIYWWDTLPVLVTFALTLFNGFTEFYFKTPSDQLIDQLTLIAWGFGTSTVVQAFFTTLEKSPLGKFFSWQ